jgi:dienelactone hydrolase
LLLFLTGGTGLPSKNNQLQADKYATEGFLVVMPDMFDGDQAPNSMTTPEEMNLTIIEQIKLRAADVAKSFMLDMWLARHTPEKVMPILYKVLEGAKEEFADAVANGDGVHCVGYCLGAKYCLQLASERPAILPSGQKLLDEEAGLIQKGPFIKSGAIAHGTLVTKEDFDGIKSPMMLVCVENDQLFPHETLEFGERYLKENQIPHETRIFPNVPHGLFAIMNFEAFKTNAH